MPVFFALSTKSKPGISGKDNINSPARLAWAMIASERRPRTGAAPFIQ